MQKIILLIIFLSGRHFVFGQNDFIVFKKGYKTIENFVSGDYIHFETKSKQWHTARIQSIKSDSLYLLPYVFVQTIDYWGLPHTDTSWTFRITVSYKDIYAFPKQKESFSYIRNGFVLQAGSAGYAGLNVINTLEDKQPLFDKQNGKRLGIAAAIFSLGEILHLTYKPYTIIGKKYSLEYVKMGK
jgi:hypothetical protein